MHKEGILYCTTAIVVTINFCGQLKMQRFATHLAMLKQYRESRFLCECKLMRFVKIFNSEGRNLCEFNQTDPIHVHEHLNFQCQQVQSCQLLQIVCVLASVIPDTGIVLEHIIQLEYNECTKPCMFI